MDANPPHDTDAETDVDVEPAEPVEPVEPELDPRRWVTLGILIASVVLIAIDISVLNVSIPTILRDLDTTVPSLEWVITGYSLTFASLLIIGGQLGDTYGHRKLFIIGVSLFGTGSLLASVSQSVGVLIIGEAIIEGVGASLMSPATLAILSTTFRGRERATAFAAWGATIGAAVAFGPVLGGFLTTNYSWRWSFRINVVVAPIAIIGALLFMGKGTKAKTRPPLDIPGAAMIASGMFLLVFSLSQGGIYGWWRPTEDFAIGGWTIWPASFPISVAPAALVAAAVVLTAFVLYERAKERRHANPLFEFSQLRHKTFRYGLITIMILSMGQLSLLFALPLFLQEAEHLSAQENGLWLLPLGLAVIVGAQVGGRLTRRITATSVARSGLIIETCGSLLIVHAIAPDMTFLQVLPGLVLFGIGIGFASSQLTNVILSEVSIAKSGVASGANSTARQIGAALGAAVIGSVITVQTTSRAIATILASPTLPEAVKAQAAAGVQAMGPNFEPSPSLGPIDRATLDHALASALADATRLALLFGTAVVFGGALLSFLIPRVKVPAAKGPTTRTVELAETFDDFEPVRADPREMGEMGDEPAPTR